MEKKNTMLLTIIAVATLLVAVVGATFAYFTAQNGASGTTTATVTTETIGAITVSNEDPALYLDLTAAQMQEGVTGSYWATKIKGAEPATNYASADKAVIAKLNVSGGGEETVYSCNFKITVDKTDVTLAYGDAAVVFALENNAEILGVTSGSEIDYTTLLNEYTVNFTRVGDTEEDLPLVSVSMRVSNTEVEQGFAGETLTTTFTSSDLECEVVDESDVKTLSGTWRFNDVLTAIGNYEDHYINYTITSNVPGVGKVTALGTAIDQSNETGVHIAFTLTSDVLELSNHRIYLYGEGWDTDNYGEGIKTITFTEEQQVSDEFWAWFTANATRMVDEQINGVWKFDDFLGSNVIGDQEINFTTTLNGETTNCIGIELWETGGSWDMSYIKADGTSVWVYSYGGGEWQDEGARIIDFGESQVVFLWFKQFVNEKATQVIGVNELPTENIDTSAIYIVYEYTDINSTNPTTIGAGTYRFNDVLTSNEAVEDLDTDLSFTFTTSIPGYAVVNCKQISLSIVSDTQDFEVVYFYDNDEWDFVYYSMEWKTSLDWILGYTNEIYPQTITITEEQEVSSEFVTWFVENAKMRGNAKYYQYIDGSWVEQ